MWRIFLVSERMRYALLIAVYVMCLGFAACTPNKVDTLPPEGVMNPRGT